MLDYHIHSVSCIVTKGVSANLMKTGSKRRRTRKEIADAKAAESSQKSELAS